MSDYQLTCVNCSQNYSLNTINSRCHECDEPLELRYDLSEIPNQWFQTRRTGCFALRYEPFYPYLNPRAFLSMGEGQTPLLESVSLGKKIELKKLMFKNDTLNPTWSFKDRGTAYSIQNAVKLGYQRLGTLSSGNMGASVAAYGNRAGMKTLVFLKENVSKEKIGAIAIYGGEVFQVIGDYSKAYQSLLEIGTTQNIYFSLSDDPWRCEGYKSLAFEIYEQTNGQLPDFLAVPVGSGGLFRGILKGFEELKECGITSIVPKMIGVQSAENSPLVDAFEKKADHVESYPHSNTLDHVLENPRPPSGNQVLRKLKTNRGFLIKVSNEEILRATRLLAEEGIFAQSASATCLGGVIQAKERNLINGDSIVITVITGSGLKYPPILKEFNFSPTKIEHDQLSKIFKTA